LFCPSTLMEGVNPASNIIDLDHLKRDRAGPKEIGRGAFSSRILKSCWQDWKKGAVVLPAPMYHMPFQ